MMDRQGSKLETIKLLLQQEGYSEAAITEVLKWYNPPETQ